MSAGAHYRRPDIRHLGTYAYLPGSNILDWIDGTRSSGPMDNGNITSKNNRTFQYDLLNRLVEFLEPDVTIARYTYAGQQIKNVFIPARMQSLIVGGYQKRDCTVFVLAVDFEIGI